MRQVRGRFAPSPSGEMHLGNVWTALLAWLGVRSLKGEMILRIEDLDPERSRSDYAQQIMSDLRWLGLDWDEGPDIGGQYGPYTQGERRNIYQEFVKILAERGMLYPCFCSRAELHAPTLAPHSGEIQWCYPGTCRSLTQDEKQSKLQQGRRPLLRVAVPDREFHFVDAICGEFGHNLRTACGDFVVSRSDGVHAYQLAVVVDDALMAITQVVRGADLLASTPRQLFLYEVLDLKPPETFAHVPLLCDKDGHRLSKRQQSLSLAAMRRSGMRAEAIVGFLACRAGLIDRYEPVAPQDLVAGFSFALLSKDPVVIDNVPGVTV